MIPATRETLTEYTNPYRPLPVRLLNRIASNGNGFGRIGADAVIKAAKESAGFADFGAPDFEDRIQILVSSINAEANLHPLGAFMAGQHLRRLLTTRLNLIRLKKMNPQRFVFSSSDPVFISGLQRSGTTKLHRMLAGDPRFRVLSCYEALQPIPDDHNGGGWWRRLFNQDGRILATRVAKAALKYLSPDFNSVHPVGAEDPEEDCLLFDYDLRSTVFDALWRVPGYSAWLDRQDQSDMLKHYRSILAHLMYQRPADRWLLKSPQHLEYLEQLLKIFPGSLVILTHRDPARTVPSFCSMIGHSRNVFSDETHPLDVAASWVGRQVKMASNVVECNRNYGSERFVHVHYKDLVERPERVIRNIYTRLGRDLSDATFENIMNWSRENPQHLHGRHRYRITDFGMEIAAIRERFAEYMRVFNVEEED